jgi:DNA modification methylase
MKKYCEGDCIDWFIPYCIEIERVIKPTGSFILNINDKVEGGFRHPYVFDLISRLHKETGLKCLRGCSGIK